MITPAPFEIVPEIITSSLISLLLKPSTTKNSKELLSARLIANVYTYAGSYKNKKLSTHIIEKLINNLFDLVIMKGIISIDRVMDNILLCLVTELNDFRGTRYCLARHSSTTFTIGCLHIATRRAIRFCWKSLVRELFTKYKVSPTDGNKPLLFSAIKRGNKDLVDFIISQPNNDYYVIGTLTGNTVYHILAQSPRITCNLDRVKILQSIISAGANCNTKNFYGFTPLALAIQNDLVDIVKVLIDHLPLLMYNKIPGHDLPLCYAVSKDAKKTVNLLLERGANPNIIYNNMSLLSFAISRVKCISSIDITASLLKYGANINQGSGSNVTPLHMSLSAGILSKVLQAYSILPISKLIKPNLEIIDNHRETPLQQVLRKGPYYHNFTEFKLDPISKVIKIYSESLNFSTATINYFHYARQAEKEIISKYGLKSCTRTEKRCYKCDWGLCTACGQLSSKQCKICNYYCCSTCAPVLNKDRYIIQCPECDNMLKTIGDRAITETKKRDCSISFIF